ncbi:MULTISPECIES: ABC transporter permease [Actinomadura]|uniref:ABC transporter permease n=1 Tax=Actinomadura litoris TaxID=2678616 RepID=A0A7K1L0G7_9ACTN|nr:MULTISPECIES: ABC transporter permease [Actinomadura]MBT2211750.1 ABC transporter permease [Actinomadura sp. NEAU-AAG7]MUN37755.1 ABC transporter permease [Actinomadura litoris]
MWIAPERRSLSRWAVPGLVLAAGVVVGAVLAADGRSGTALTALAALTGYAGYLAYRRNEPALPLGEGFGSGHRARAHLRAAAMTGDVVTVAVVAALVVQALRGADIAPYAWLAALAGGTYLLSALAGGRGL